MQTNEDRIKELETACRLALGWMSQIELVALVMGNENAKNISEGTRYGMGLAADAITKQLKNVLGDDHAT